MPAEVGGTCGGMSGEQVGPFLDPRKLPAAPVRNIVRAVVAKTLDDLRLLQRELRSKSVSERRMLLGRALKVHRHRLIQLYGLLVWARSVGLIAERGQARHGPLAKAEAAELRVIEQLDALHHAIEGNPGLYGCVTLIICAYVTSSSSSQRKRLGKGFHTSLAMNSKSNYSCNPHVQNSAGSRRQV